MTNLIDEIKAQTEEIQRIKDDMTSKLRPRFKELFTPFFEKYDITSVFWTQYIPQFNDGEPCEFTIGEVYCHIEALDGVIEDEEEWCNCSLPISNYTFEHYKNNTDSYYKDAINKLIKYYGTIEKVKEINEEIKSWINNLQLVDDSIFEDLFGCESLVTVTKDGITTEEYECCIKIWG